MFAIRLRQLGLFTTTLVRFSRRFGVLGSRYIGV